MVECNDWSTTTTVLHHLKDVDNEPAWNRLSSRFRKPIERFVRKLGLSATDAEEVAQDTLAEFARAYSAGRYDRDKGRLRAWLFGIAYRQMLNMRRRLNRRGLQVSGEDGSSSFWGQLPDRGESASCWDDTWDRCVLERCMERVRHEVAPSTFAAFRISVLENTPPQEAAARLGISVQSVYNAKHRILKRVRQLSREYETI